MGKYLKKFSTDSDRIEYEGGNDYIEPYVSYVEGDNSVHYNKVETRLIVRYNVEDASNPTLLYGYYAEEGEEEYWVKGVDLFGKVEIDRTEVAVADLDTAQGRYQLSSGEHTVKYTLIDPTSIGGSAFSNCNGLTSVTIPDSVTSIGESAFYNCSSLTSVTIGSGVTSIGEDAFGYCSSLTSIGPVGSGASVEMPNSVTSIGYSAFRNCSGLTSIIIPDGVTSIGNTAFIFCGGLTSATIGSGVTSIGINAFDSCSSLTSITIPNSVTSIGKYAFADCNSLTSVTIEATTPPTLGVEVFTNTRNCTIWVPDGTANTYKAATNWSTYASRIQEIPTT